MQSSSTEKSVFKQAVFNQYNVILLGGMGLLSAAAGSTVPALMAAGGEMLWLLAGARSERFRHWVVKQERLRDEQLWRARIEKVATGLDPGTFARVRLVSAALMQLARAADERGQPQFVAAVAAKLEVLLPAYASLAAALQRLGRLVAVGGTAAIEAEIARLNGALAEEGDSTVRISLRQAVGQAQRRLKRFEQVETLRRDLTVKMSTFEASLEFETAEVRGGEPEDEVLRGLDEIVMMTRFNPSLEADVTRTFNERRTVSGMFPLGLPPEAR